MVIWLARSGRVGRRRPWSFHWTWYASTRQQLRRPVRSLMSSYDDASEVGGEVP